MNNLPLRFLTLFTVLLAAAVMTEAVVRRGSAVSEEAYETLGKDGADAPALVAVLHPLSGSNVRGTVTFTPLGDGRMRVEANLQGLEPETTHAIHIHEYGDLRAYDGTTAGSHFNPTDQPHGLPDEDERHVGDLGNLRANSRGEALHTLEVDNLSWGDGKGITGRAVIVHEQEDDGSQPTGNAGGRIAGGVIGIAQAPAAEQD